MINPWQLTEYLMGLGLGERVARAMVHEALYPEMFIEMRAKGFEEHRYSNVY